MRAGLRSLATLLSAVAVATCSDAPNGVHSGPSPAQVGRIGVAPVFSRQAQFVATNAGAFGLAYDAVRLVIRGNPDTTVVVKDTTIAFTSSSSAVTLDIPVPVVIDGQKFNVSLDYTSQTSGVLFHGTLVATSYRPGRPAPPQEEIDIEYVGPGAKVARLAITPDTTTVVGSASAALTVSAFDDAGAATTAPPLLWSTSDASIVTIVGTTDKVSAQGHNIRGKALVSVISPSGAADTSSITVALPPASIDLVSGAGQTGEVHTALAAPAVVQVSAVDGIGVPGVTVVFAAPDGGAVGNASVVTDANGRATTTMTLGTVAGPQSFAATAAGFSKAITATATPGSAAAIAVASGNAQTDSVGKALAPLTVRVADAFANVVPNAVITWTRVRGSGTLGSATSTTNASGVATNTYTLGTIAGSDSIAVSSGSATIAGFAFTTNPGNPALITAVSGGGQTASTGATLAPFVAKVTDANGNASAGATVAWTPTNGTMPATTTTGTDGQTSNVMTLGGSVGAASATATIAGKTVTFSATTTAGGGSALAFSTQPVNVANNVTMAAVAVTVKDAFGNLVTTNTPVTIALGGNQVGATLGGTLTRTTTNGVATFDDLSVDRAGTGFTLIASSGSIATATSSAFNVTASGAAQVLLVPSSPTAFTKQAGGSVATPPTIKVVNASGAPIPNAPVRFVTTLGQQTVGDVTIDADPNGLLLTNVVPTPDIVGVYTITATSTSAPGSSVVATLTVTPGDPSALVFVLPNGTTVYTAQVGAAITPAFRIEVRDAFGNVTTGNNSVGVALTNPSGATLGGTTSKNAVNGVVTFSDLTINIAQNGYVLRALASGLPVATSAPINILAPGGVQLVIVGAGNGVAGSPLAPAITVEAHDAQGQLITTATPSVTLELSTLPNGGIISGGGPVTAVNGVATFGNVVLNKAGVYGLRATAAGAAPGISADFEIVAGPAAVIAKVDGDNLTAPVSTPTTVPPKVRVTDALDNPVAGATVGFNVVSGLSTFKRTPTDDPITSGVVVTDEDGFATLESWTMGATATVNTLTAHLVNTSQTVTFTATSTNSVATSIALFSGNNQTGTVGAALAQPLVVKVTDAGGNAVSGVSVTWTGDNGSLAATTTTGANGQSSNTFTLGTIPGAASATATIAGGGTITFNATANAGPAAQLLFTATPPSTTAATVMAPVSVQLRDQFGNPTTASNAVTVSIATNPSTGTLSGTTTVNAVNGTATFSNLSIDKSGSGYSLRASSAALPTVTTALFDINPGAAAHITIVSGDNQSAVVGGAVASAPRVRVTDAGGNGVNGASVTFSIVTGGGKLRFTPTGAQITTGTATSDASGFAAVDAWFLGAAVGSNSVEAHLTAVPSATVTFSANASSGPANAIGRISGTAQTGAAGSVLAAPFVVKVTDGTNPVQGAVVNWTAVNGTIAARTFTDANGLSSNTMTLGGTLGTDAASATAAIASGNTVTFSATVTAGPAATLAVTTQPPATVASGATLAPVTFAIRDAFGNATAATNAVTIALTTPAGATLGGTTTRNAVGGSVTFNDLSIDKIGSYTLTATSAGLTSQTTSAVVVAAGAPAHIAILAGDNTIGVVNGATVVAPLVRVTDAAGNNVQGATVSFVVGGAQGSVTPGSVNTDVNGRASATWTLGATATAYTLDASVVGAGSVTFHATASNGAAASIALQSGDAQTGIVGTALAQPFVVRVTDGSGNPVAGTPVAWSSLNGTFSSPTTLTQADGTASATMTLGNVAGAVSATATIPNAHFVSFSATATAGAASRIVVTTQPTNTTSGTTMSAVTFALRDQFGNATNASLQVSVSLTTPAGAVLGGTTTHNAVGGSVTFNDLTVDKAGTYTITASGVGLTAATTTSFTVGAGAAAQLAIVEGDNAGGVVNQATSPAPKVVVTDAAGNTVSGATVTYNILTGNGTVKAAANSTPSATATVTSDANGNAAPNAWILGPALGANTIEARLSASVAVTFTANASSGAGSLIELVSGGGQSGTVGAALGTPIVVKVSDAFNNPVNGATVTWSASNGTPTNATTTTGADGTTSNTLTFGHTAGAASATATIAGGANVNIPATAVAGAAAQVAFTTQPTNTVSAVAMTPVVLAVRDQFGNATTATNSVTLAIGTNPAAGSLSGTVTRAAVNGTATFDDLTIDKAGTGYTLSAASAGLTGATSTAFNITPGAAAQLAIVAGDNVNAVINTATSPAPSVRVTDAHGNNVPNASVTFAIASGGGSITPAGGVVTSDANGLATLGAWTMSSTTGAHTLTASIAGSTVTFHATAASSAPNAIAIQSGDQQTATVATAVASPLVVHVTDAFGNNVVGGVVAWTATNGTVASATSVTDVTGSASNTLTLGNTAGAGASSVTATIAGHQVVFTATPTAGAPARLAITTQPTNGTAATALSAITVGLRDQFNNPTTGTNAISAAIATNPGGGTLSGTSPQSAVNGTATFSDLSIEKAGVGYTLTFSGAGLTPATTNAFTVVAGAAANIAINAGDNAGAAVLTATTPSPQVKVTDANGNVVAGATITYTILTGNGTVKANAGSTPAGSASVTSDVNGLATLNAWILGPTIGSNTLEARLNGTTAVTFTANASSAAVSAIAISAGDGQSAIVAQQLSPFVVRVADAQNNPVTGAVVTWTATGGTLSASSTTTGSDGLTSSTMTLGVVAGSVSATATVSNGQHVTFTGTAQPGSATQMTFNAQPSNTVAGAAMSPVIVAVRDVFGNVVTSSSASVALAIANNPSNGTLSGTATRAAVNGIATFNDLAIDRVGSGYTLTATSVGLTTTTSNAFAILVGVPAHIAIVEGDGQSSVVDQTVPIAPKVRITDASNNVVPNASVTFSIASGAGAIKLTSAGSFVTSGAITTDANGIAVIDSWKLGPALGTNTLEARVSPSLAVTFTASSSSGIPNGIAISSGNTQSGVVATALAAPFVAHVSDINANPVTGAAVTWTATNGTISATTFTDANGNAANTLTLGTLAGAASATATIGNGAHVTFNATALAGAAASMVFTSQPPSTTANVILPSITLQLRDQYGNNTPATNSVSLSLGNNPTNANLTGTTTRAAVAGVVTFDDVAVDGAGAGYTLLAQSSGVTSATSNAFNVASDVVSFINITSGDGQTGTVHTAASQPLIVTIEDAGHALITAANITWTAAHGTVLSSSETTSGTDGRTSITIQYDTLAGADTITAQSINGHIARFVVTATPGNPVKLAYLVPNGTSNYSATTTAPIAVPSSLQVAIEDVYGNIVTSSTSAVSLTLNSPNGAQFLNAPTTNAALGVASFDQAQITKVGVYTVTATSTGLASATSLPISVQFGGVTGVEFITKTGTGTAGVVVTPTIQVKLTDAQGNLVLTPVPITLSITFSSPAGGTVTGTLTVNTDQGIASFTDIVFPRAGTYRLKADATSSGYNTVTSGNFVISP